MRIVLFLFLFVSTFVFGQKTDLISLSSGKFMGITSLFDNDRDLYGYVSVYDKGEVDKATKEFEIILIDPNLNRVSNVKFESSIFVSEFDIYMNINDEIIISPTLGADKMGEYIKMYKSKHPDNLVVDFSKKTTKVSPRICFNENKEFESCKSYESLKEKEKENMAQYKKDKYKFVSDVSRLKDKSYLINDYKMSGPYYNVYLNLYYESNIFTPWKDAHISLYDENQKLKWDFTLDENPKKNYIYKAWFYESGVGENDQLAYLRINKYKKKKTESLQLLGLDLNTGKEILREDITEQLFERTYPIRRFEIDNYLIDVQELTTKKSIKEGFRRMKLNLNTQKVEWDDLLFEDLHNRIKDIDNKGFTNSGFTLKTKDAFVNDDGSVFLLLEEFKIYHVPINRDFYLVETDKDFKLKNIHIIQKQKSKQSYSDFLFWQKLDKNKNDIVFFYKDKRKDEETKKDQNLLGISSIINGKFKFEEIVLNNETTDSEIVPLFAKRGYILIWENDKDKNKSSIRLEKLNL